MITHFYLSLLKFSYLSVNNPNTINKQMKNKEK